MPSSAFPPGSAVVAYARDSGGQSQDRSVAQQLAAIEAYCRENGLTLVRTWADEAQPGSTTTSRDQFLEMVAWLRKLAPEPEARKPRHPDAPDGLVYWDVRRFGRDQDDSAYYRADLRRRGYAVLSLADDIPAGDLAPVFESLFSWKAEQDLRDLSRDIKRGLRDLVQTRNGEDGFLHCWPGKVPPGFHRIEVQAGTRRDGRPRLVQGLEPDRDGEWERVGRAFELRAMGSSIARIHAEVGICPRRRAYYHLFRNELYHGTLAYSGQVIENWIEPCVDAATWERVQSVNQNHGRPRTRASGYTLSGLFRCGECGSPLTGKTNRLHRGERSYTYRRYACRRARSGWESCPQHKLLDADRLERAIYAVLAEKVLRPDTLAALFEHIDHEQGPTLAAGVARLEAELDRLDRIIGRLVDGLEAGVPEVAERLHQRQAERKVVESQLRDAREKLDAAQRGPVPEAVIRAFCEEMATVLALGQPEAVRDVLLVVVVEGRAWADGRGELAYKSPWAGMVGRVEFAF